MLSTFLFPILESGKPVSCSNCCWGEGLRYQIAVDYRIPFLGTWEAYKDEARMYPFYLAIPVTENGSMCLCEVTGRCV